MTTKIDRRIDRREELSPYEVLTSPLAEVTSSPFVSSRLEFTVQRKVRRLNRIIQSIFDATNNSTEQLDALKNLSALIEADPRLSNHLPTTARLFRYLFKFLQDDKTMEFQFYSAGVLENLLSSEIGLEFKDQAIPSLVKLIFSPHTSVQAQALLTLTKTADKFPDSCHAMINNGALDHLESLLTNSRNHFDSLQNGGQLLTAFCRIEPHLPPDKLGKVVSIIRAAINKDIPAVRPQVCLALSILSDRRLVEITTEVGRLVDLIDHWDNEMVFCALRTIGNYVRWASEEEFQLMIRPSLLTNLGKLLDHGYKILRKEACWIISNIACIANKSQLNEVQVMGLMHKLIRVVTHDEPEVKNFAADALVNLREMAPRELHCYSCDRTFDSYDAITSHNSMAHADLMALKTKVECDYCGTLFRTELDLVQHKDEICLFFPRDGHKRLLFLSQR